MRSFNRTATLTALLIAVPLAGAYAAGHHKGALDEAAPTDLTGPRVAALIEQVQGVDKGITDASRRTPSRRPRRKSCTSGLPISARPPKKPPPPTMAGYRQRNTPSCCTGSTTSISG